MWPVTDRIMCRGLISKSIGNNISFDQPLQQVNCIATNPDALARSLLLVTYSPINRFIDIRIFLIEIPCSNSFINPPFLNLRDQRNTFIHRNSERLRTSHTAEAGSNIKSAFQRSSVRRET